MGKYTADDWWLWDFGNTEATVKVAEPTKLTDSNAANVFVIPIALGAKVTPLSGPLFPEIMPEMVHPMVWITGDSQIGEFSATNGHIDNQHVDFWAGEYMDLASIKIEPPIILMSWGGVVTLKASGGMNFTAGKPVNGLCQTGVQSVLGDGRVSASANGCTPLSTVHRKHRSWDLDKPSLDAFDLASEAPLAFFHVQNGFDLLPYHEGAASPFIQQWVAPVTKGMATRLIDDDDRSVVLLDRAKQWLTLEGFAGVDIGPIRVGVNGRSELSAEVHHYTSVREHASIVKGDKMKPNAVSNPNEFGLSTAAQTNLVVATHTTYKPVFNPLTLTADFTLNICFDLLFDHVCIDVHWSDDFLTLGNLLTAPPPKFLPEPHRLRVGIYSDHGREFTEPDNGTAGRNVFSHLPDTAPANASNPTPFVSWPPGGNKNVPTCLNDNTVPTKVPPPPDLGKEGTEPPGFVCHYGLSFEGTSSGMTQNICTDATVRANFIDFWSSTAAQSTCLNNTMNYLCAGTSKPQFWGAEGWVVSRRYTPTQANNIANILRQCADAYNTATDINLAAENAGALVRSMLHMHACHADATLEGDPP